MISVYFILALNQLHSSLKPLLRENIAILLPVSTSLVSDCKIDFILIQNGFIEWEHWLDIYSSSTLT